MGRGHLKDNNRILIIVHMRHKGLLQCSIKPYEKGQGLNKVTNEGLRDY